MAEKTTAFEATKAQIEKWKKLHGDVFRLEVGDKACYVKRPTRTQIAMITEMGTNQISEKELLLTEVWLDGDEEIKTDDAYFLGAIVELNGLIQIKAASLKKL